uniref:Si:dkey-16n15.6 n=1 Tax=Amphiprion percula TaxID=161767 RepID=A0A3P8T7Q1_AMPPE
RYHSITLLKFMGLITDFFGGKARMLVALSGQQVSPDPFPCCCCCCFPMVAINMMAAVLQLSVVRSILFFVTLVLWTDEQYDYGDVDSVNPNLYVNAIIGVSTFVSFYGHLLFYKATKSALHGHGLRPKFICIIVVLVLCGLQSGILETMGALAVIPCTPPFSVLSRSQSPGYNTDSEDSLCRIEHTPLDGFDFPQAKGQHRSQPEPVQPRSAEKPSVEMNHITVKADVTYD